MRLPIPRLITFDVTGTLLMTKLEQHYVEAAASHGLDRIDVPRIAKAFKTNFKRLENEHPIFGKSTGLGWQNWWRSLVHEVFRDQDRAICSEKLDKIADSLIECYSTSRCWHKYPGTDELLESLSRRRPRVVLGVISNFDERLEAVLDDARIRSYFSFVITSYGLGVEKPSPAIFQEALRLSSIDLNETIRPDEAIHIGDRVDNDYLGARSANWNAILINREDDPIDEKVVDPRDVFRHFDDLKTHFDSLLTRNAAYGR
ncbi:hypothetical protein TSAR_005827 [Trichomalopsis sarcophagae]|uniref:Rhythmically expressed gene 2 protein n=1 Tax=Trichomalopsis sarcophagae TaxID=543379 RepID=A0A232F4Z9_9HYME|nr:hypothetical protein TSAR_005827 [Trichomalopsis sarcophagae]